MKAFLILLVLVPGVAFGGSLAEPIPSSQLEVSPAKSGRFFSFALKSALKSLPGDAVVVGHECQPVADEFECVVLYRMPSSASSGRPGPGWFAMQEEGRTIWVEGESVLDDLGPGSRITYVDPSREGVWEKVYVNGR